MWEKAAISFGTAVPSGDEIARRIVTTLARTPWLVWEGAAGFAAYTQR